MKRLVRSLIPHPDGETFWVPLTKGKFARIDKEDAEVIGQHNWRAVKKGRDGECYARTKINGKDVEMQRLIMQQGRSLDGLVVDHVNFDTLDNRSWNLQITTNTRNLHRTRERVAGGQALKSYWRGGYLKPEPQPVFSDPLPPPRLLRTARKTKVEQMLERFDEMERAGKIPPFVSPPSQRGGVA